MKKITFSVLIIGTLFIFPALYAQTAEPEIVIQSVTGLVTYEVSAGKWEKVTTDKKLTASVQISTGLNSSLTLKTGGEIITIPAMQKGTIEKLIASSENRTGIKLGAVISETPVAASTQERTNISTASTRAEKINDEVKWIEEEKEKK